MNPFHPVAVGVMILGLVVWAVLGVSSWGVKDSWKRDKDGRL
jgi:hypothetical protein